MKKIILVLIGLFLLAFIFRGVGLIILTLAYKILRIAFFILRLAFALKFIGIGIIVGVLFFAFAKLKR